MRYPTARVSTHAAGHRPSLRCALALLLMLIVGSGTAVAQALSGTYNVGGAGDTYATIEAAIADLNLNGVSGPVMFRINGGTYTPPTGGYVLSPVTGMSATNTVTFKPKTGASVVIDGTLASAIFSFSGGDYFILDGTNGTGTSRDMKIINRNTSNPVILFINGAQNNVVRNVVAMGSATGTTTGIIKMSTSNVAGVGNSYNRISRNTLGDSSGTIRSSTVYYQLGTSSAQNTANVIEYNDAVNHGATTTGYGFYLDDENIRTHIIGNQLRVPNKGSWTSTSYGIYVANGDMDSDSIAGNRVHDIQSGSATGSVYSIYVSTAQAGRPIWVVNNTVSLNTTGGTVYALYFSATTNVYAYYNSVSLTGDGTSTSVSYGVYKGSGAVLTLKNNIIANTRTGSGTNSNRTIYVAGTTGALTSDHNAWFYSTATSNAMGYLGGTYYATLAAWQAATGHDANSVQGDPQFVDPANGDLHISTTNPTPIESKGTPVTGFTVDMDGNTRHGTRPDIGADEGSFTLLRNNDMQAIEIVEPGDGAIRQAGLAFTPSATVANGGLNAQNAVPVRMIIRDAGGAVVYEDIQTTDAINSGGRRTLLFSQTGSVSGSTALAAGNYTIEVRTMLAGDDDTSNDTVRSSFETKAPLAGTYTIDPAGAGSRNFPTFTAAVAELNQVGVNAPVTFLIAGGTYSTAETFPLHIGAILGATSTNTVTFRPNAGATVSLVGAGTPALFELDGADYVTLDGSNTAGGTSRNWTITSTSTGDAAIRLENGAQYNTIRNMILRGSSTSTADGIVAIGTSNASGVGNSYNRILSNTVGDVNGSFRSAVGIYNSGTSSAVNTGNVIERNDVVNFSTGTSSGYGVYVGGSNQQVRVAGNNIGIPVKTGAGTSTIYGIYWTNSASQNDTIIGNRVYDLQPGDNVDTYRGIYIGTSATTSTPVIINNMVQLNTDGASTVAGIYVSDAEDTIVVSHNTVVLTGGNGGSDDSYGIYVGTMTASEYAWVRNNIIVNERTGSGTGDNRAIGRSSTVGTMYSSNNVLYVPTHSSSAIGYVSSARTTLADWQGTGHDQNSILQRPQFVNESIGDLHLDHMIVPFKGEGMALPGVFPIDFDGDARSAVMPDIGADEGNFNGGGLALQYPNGGEQFAIEYDLPVRWTANRPLPSYIEFSSDNGATWTRMSTVPAAQVGPNTTVITLPTQETTTARVRVISQLNDYEADTSDASFSLVRPVFVVRTPNGGESWVPTDTVGVRWTSEFMPRSQSLDIEHSTDGGQTWRLIANDLPSRNLPDTNVFNWVVPDMPGGSNLIRVHIPGTRSTDISNAPFTIQTKPSLTLTSLDAGGRFFAGETVSVDWTAVNTRNVRLEYSTDGGATWSAMMAGGKQRIGASIGSYAWTVPAIDADRALVRVVNDERTRFADTSAPLEIVIGRLAVLSPNGGEKYELNQPITVTFDAPHSDRLRLEFSSDGGSTWQLVDGAVDASAGSHTFTPAGIPTPRALVRLTDESRVALSDMSDNVFEIMEARSIVVFSPTLGEQLMRSTIYPITWQAVRIARVNIDYSPNGGAPGSWTRVASNVAAGEGSYNWTVPSTLTQMGVIRISEVGGALSGESGQFSIVAPVTSVRVLRPNGGETYTAGDEIVVGWTSANVATVSLEFSSDAGASWWPIASNLPATQATYRWTAPSAPGTTYRVKVIGGALSDMSDGNFTIVRRIVPSLTVLYPNGGERMTVDSAVVIAWRAMDYTGDVTVSYSIDNGGNWTEIATAPASAGQIPWTVPAALSQQALVKVEGAAGLSDVSDAVFAIEAQVERTLTLSTPNSATVVWREGEDAEITWTAQNVGDVVVITLSTDGGATWPTTIAPSASATAGSLTWRVPHLSDVELTTLRVKVATPDGVYEATSLESFTFRPTIGGVETGAGATRGLELSGAYPNPFMTETELRWSQSYGSSMTLRVYGSTGALLSERSLGHREAGRQSARIDAALLPAGTYHVELRSTSDVVRTTITVVR